VEEEKVNKVMPLKKHFKG